MIAGNAMVTNPRSQATEADLLAMPDDGRKYELVDGEIRVSPAGTRHGLIGAELVGRLLAFVKASGRGYVFDSSTGFHLPKGNVRSPDVSFVARGRFPGEVAPEGFSPVAPDLAVEILSPEDRSRFVLEKVGEYLDAGVPLVWVIDPRARNASIYRSLTEVRKLSEADELDGEDVLPGFRCRLADIL
jgi:Uma2 family endonuclease